MRWTVLLPLKPLGTAKSRLRGAVPAPAHERLVLALAMDTIAAARACPAVTSVVVVTPDPAVADTATRVGARVLFDEPNAGLNPALDWAAARVAGSVAALAGDLPALRPADLAEALSEAGTGRAYVPDAAGEGTTLLAAPAGLALAPRFGPGSARAHAASGARRMDGEWPTLRRDVDVPEDLAQARALGLGARTGRLLRELTGGTGAVAAGSVPRMQGTVATYDPQSRSGTLLLDDGREVPFPGAAFDASGLRSLRFGQRVRIEVDGEGEITKITLPTFT